MDIGIQCAQTIVVMRLSFAEVSVSLVALPNLWQAGDSLEQRSGNSGQGVEP